MKQLKINLSINNLKNKVNYIFDTLLSPYTTNIKNIDFDLFYGKDNDSSFTIWSDEQIWKDIENKVIVFANSIKYLKWKEKRVPILFYDVSFDENIDYFNEIKNKTINILPVDIIASAFYCLVGIQEYNSCKDIHNRYVYNNSLQHNLNIPFKPLIREYEDILIDLLGILSNGLVFDRKVWPDDKKMAICLTHDIDRLKKIHLKCYLNFYLLLLNGSITFSEFLKRLMNFYRYLLKRKDPYFNLKDIVDLENQYDIKSSFLFLLDHKTKFGCDYSILENKVSSIIKYLHNMGWEVALHGSYYDLADSNVYKDQIECLKSIIGDCVYGHRQHFLRLDLEKTYSCMNSCNMIWDSTSGFAEMPGYRNFYNLPFFPYDIKNDKPYNFLELPLTIMDCSLSSYQNLLIDESYELCIDILEHALKTNGLVVINWHNTYFGDGFAISYEWKHLYEKLLIWGKENDAWITNGYDIATYWLEKTQ